MGAQIHWFPGHMNKALKEIQERVHFVDVVIELLDMRIPISSVNKEFEKIVSNKKKLYVLTKTDLADPIQSEKWIKYFTSNNYDFLSLNLLGNNIEKQLSLKIRELGKEKHEKEIQKGMKPQAIKAMIIGIPNVGKSSLINKLAKRNVAGVQNKPGFTRGEQIIKVNNDFLLLDTPGVLPMNYEDKNKAINLALAGSIKEDILPKEDLAIYLIKYLCKFYPNAIKNRYNVENNEDFAAILKQIAINRGFIISNGVPDIDKAATILLKEFKDGKLGKISLEWCD